MDTFDKLIGRVLGHEGGYVNNPADPGGETKWGIAKRSYPKLDIRNLTREAAIAIYQRDFWGPIKGDQLPPAVAYQVLDGAVNHGPKTAVRWLQRAVGATDDGVIGPLTLAAVARHAPANVVLSMIAERLAFYTALPTWPSFGRGWTNRVAGNLRYASEDL